MLHFDDQFLKNIVFFHVCIDRYQIHEALGHIVKKDFPLTQKFNNHRQTHLNLRACVTLSLGNGFLVMPFTHKLGLIPLRRPMSWTFTSRMLQGFEILGKMDPWHQQFGHLDRQT